MQINVSRLITEVNVSSLFKTETYRRLLGFGKRFLGAKLRLLLLTIPSSGKAKFSAGAVMSFLILKATQVVSNRCLNKVCDHLPIFSFDSYREAPLPPPKLIAT